MPEKNVAHSPKVAVIVPAAGRGVRAAPAGGMPKQYRPLAGGSSLARTLAMFAAHPGVATIVVPSHPDDSDLLASQMPVSDVPIIRVDGGATRQASVRAGLEALVALAPDIVLIHDAARPFASSALVDRAIAAAVATGAAVPALPVADTVIEANADGRRGATLSREHLRTVQTPQSFRYDLILAAHRAAAQAGRDDFTDDGALAVWHGHEVALFDGESANTKLTTADDMMDAQQRFALADALRCADVRTGTGFDVHAFTDGDHVILGGLRIAHTAGLGGHSDADVVLHALTDAVLGALSDGDIGTHFPPSDPRWKGQDSSLFLEDAIARVAKRGGVVAHLDVTVICEAPKIGPHREPMRERIAAICGVPLGRVSVKATTTEQLGFAGRREGIAAMASATIRLPFDGDGDHGT